MPAVIFHATSHLESILDILQMYSRHCESLFDKLFGVGLLNTHPTVIKACPIDAHR
jgi:hypothetical protein